MKVASFVVLCHIGWLSATLMIYHEPSMKKFGDKITTNNTLLNKTYNSFGYSVTYIPDIKRLIVSAPKATDHGALFLCDIDSQVCTPIPIDTTEIQAPQGYHIWLGATVRAGSHFFMTCAPRYLVKVKDYTFTPSPCYSYFTSGAFKSQLRVMNALPDTMFSSKKFEHRKMLSFGWSMDIDEFDNAVIGGPAMFTGRAIKYEPNQYWKPILIRPGNQKEPFFNFGYSVMHRMYNSVKQLVISSTYGEQGKGMVVIFNDKNGAVISKIRGNQVGAMFGASLCTASVDSKGQSLLLVGAPTFSNDNKYNTGAAFVYRDMDVNTFKVIKGTSPGGQFGYAIANLGDLNGDNKDDIAISAPYEDNGIGAVYIYSGAQLIDRDKEVKWLQRIQRKEYRSFGLSLYAIPDHDQNGCKELALGIPENNQAVLFSCFATITVNVKRLKLKGKEVVTSGFTSFKFESCLAIQYPALPKTITANFSVLLHTQDVPINIVTATGQRSKDSASYNIDVTSLKKQEYCEEISIQKPSDTTYNPTVHYQISATLLNDPKAMTSFDPSRVTVSDLSKLTIMETAWIGECEHGEKCFPKLQMTLSLSVMDNLYVVGSTDVETLKISVQNSGDPAYEAWLQIHLDGIDLLSWPPSCMLPSEVNTRKKLICKPTKLLRNNTIWDIENIKLDMKSIKSKAEGGRDYFELNVHLHDERNEHNKGKFKQENRSLHWDSEHVTAMGVIKHGGLINITRSEIETSSKQIQHEYEIFNNGLTTWHNLEVYIYLQKEFFLDGISPTSGPFYDCTPVEGTAEAYVNHCLISTLKKNTTLSITQPIDVTSKIYETLKKRQLNVTSRLKMSLDGDEKVASVITTLRLYEIVVDTWIIVVAVLFGLLIIAIIVFILYECGFLRRKKKEDLTHLRRSVQRQSMRRSTVIKHNVDNADTEKLIDPADEANPDNETESTSSKVDGNEKVDVHPQKEIKSKHPPENCEKNNTLEGTENPVGSNDKETNTAENTVDETIKKDEDSNIDGKPSVKTKQNDPIAGIIIGGLQKNIHHKGVPANVEDGRLV